MTYDQIIKHFGGEGRGALARASERLKLSKQTLHSWKRRGVPRGVQFELRQRSRGRLHVERLSR